MREQWTNAQARRYIATGEEPVQPLTPAERDKFLSEPNKADKRQEKYLQSDCEQELNRRKIAQLHLSPFAREKKGWPDLTFALWQPGSTKQADPIAVELKVEGGSLSDAQIDMLTLMRSNGWKTYVIWNLTTFVDLLNGHMPEEWGSNEA